ncbi:hypothetical protein EVAR_29880_1 [Eumeta japonica]|uniref:Uncharacterized protein n=1 Tax=Eumeta variegata TaxID=151549 RepID=A0A4C1V9X6_EUMVA|nr:hypothetical protein EVAR_29880_1 [Eumeta japonica]
MEKVLCCPSRSKSPLDGTAAHNLLKHLTYHYEIDSGLLHYAAAYKLEVGATRCYARAGRGRRGARGSVAGSIRPVTLTRPRGPASLRLTYLAFEPFELLLSDPCED